MDRVYKKSKKTTVQLTSLLDLLFVMIFLSLIQQKQVVPTKKTPTKVVKKEVVKPAPKPVEKQIPKMIDVKAVFSFYPTTKTKMNDVTGEYLMEGVYVTESGKLNLYGVKPINLNPNIAMVPLNGKINKEQTVYSGIVDSIGCEKFEVKKVSSGSGLKGKWVGTYSCAQGETGLTLIIE